MGGWGGFFVSFPFLVRTSPLSQEIVDQLASCSSVLLLVVMSMMSGGGGGGGGGGQQVGVVFFSLFFLLLSSFFSAVVVSQEIVDQIESCSSILLLTFVLRAKRK